MRQCSNRSQRGFSLLEILTALAIISVVIGMAMLNYGSILPNFKANSAMDQLLYQLRSARERAISHRRSVQVQFVGTNQLTVTEIWLVGTAPPPTTVSFEGGAKFMVFSGLPDLPAPFNFGNTAPVYFGGVSGGPPIMQFSTTGAFTNGAANGLVNGTVFLGIPGQPSTARAISILGATGRVREYHWDSSQWQE
jgi:prepilin-type N-terminal cleavage/methylation domain-containing protein